MQLINKILDDYSELCNNALTTEFGAINSPYDPIYLYHRYKHRIIAPQSRKLVLAPNITPPPQHSQPYRQICQDIQDGANLKKYQSRMLKNLDFDDDMLSHWGIQHLHLSTNIEADGYVSRTGDLLFVLFTHESAYVLGFYRHGKWCELDLIEIIHQHWPHLISEFQGGGKAPLTKQDHKNLRSKHGNTTVTVLDGTEYLPPGFGVTANGAPLYAILSTNNILSTLRNAYSTIEKNINSIIEQTQIEPHDTLTVGLDHIDIDGVMVFVLKEPNIRFRLNEQENP